MIVIAIAECFSIFLWLFRSYMAFLLCMHKLSYGIWVHALTIVGHTKIQNRIHYSNVRGTKVPECLKSAIESVAEGKKSWTGVAQWLTLLVPPVITTKPKKRG